MTVRANSLTERVSAPARPAEAWRMPARDVAAFMDALRALGFDARALAAAARISDRDLSDPDAQVPCEALGAVVAAAQRERFTPNLALEVARATPLGAYPLLDYLVVTSDTVEAGLRQLARYLRLVGNPLALDFREESGGGGIRVELSGAAAPFSFEFLASLIVLHLRHETGGRFAVTAIAFRHAVDDAGAFARMAGCSVRASADWNGFLVSREALRLPLSRRDPVLRRLLQSHADEILARQPGRAGFAWDVQRALGARLSAGRTDIGTIARDVAVSGRTLQRRLAAEGLSYQVLLDEARRHAAERYLLEPSLAIGEVAYLVGYSEPAPFHRAFKRWFGVTPDAFRKRHRRAALRRPPQAAAVP